MEDPRRPCTQQVLLRMAGDAMIGAAAAAGGQGLGRGVRTGEQAGLGRIGCWQSRTGHRWQVAFCEWLLRSQPSIMSTISLDHLAFGAVVGYGGWNSTANRLFLCVWSLI